MGNTHPLLMHLFNSTKSSYLKRNTEMAITGINDASATVLGQIMADQKTALASLVANAKDPAKAAADLAKITDLASAAGNLGKGQATKQRTDADAKSQNA